MKELLSTERFKLWLAGDPDIGIIMDHLAFLDFWLSRLRNGGEDYVEELKELAREHMRLRTKYKQPEDK